MMMVNNEQKAQEAQDQSGADVSAQGAMNMKTIYVVTRGSYSDYGIVAVFDDKALTDEFVKHHNEDRSGWWDAAEIEEWECNPNEATLRAGMMNYSIQLSENADEGGENVAPTAMPPSQPTETTWPRGRFVNMIISAKNAEHAAKIGTEKRMIWLTYGIEAIGGKVTP